MDILMRIDHKAVLSDDAAREEQIASKNGNQLRSNGERYSNYSGFIRKIGSGENSRIRACTLYYSGKFLRHNIIGTI